MAVKLTKIQRDIIPLIAMDARESPARIARQLGIRERSARYNIATLAERGIIREAPFLNVYPLGFRYVNLYFSLSSHSSAVQQLLQALVRSPKVTWLAELGADFHFGMSLLVRQIEEVKDILDSFSRKYPAVFFEKSYAFHLGLKVFPAKYLSSRRLSPSALGYGSTGTECRVDELDLKILSTMSSLGLTSGRAIARELGRPHATVELRMRRLEREKVIAGYWYLFDAGAIGYQTLKLLIYAKGHQHALSEKLFSFARQHPNISYFIECLGSWDFELGLDVADASSVSEVSRELLDVFGASINTIKVVPMFRVLKFRQFTDLPAAEA